MRKAMIMLLFAVLLLAACDTTTTGTDPFLGGTDGVSMEFMTGAPPDEVFDGGDFPFSVVMTLKNEGEWNIPAGKATLKIDGINPLEFGVSNDDLVMVTTDDLEPSKKDSEGNIIPGTVVWMEFPEMVYSGELAGNTLFPVRANLCYEYGTRATSTLCIRENLREYTDDTVCDINEDKSVYSSGAPVVVSTFDEAVAGSDKVRFTFTLVHKGPGTIYKMETGCDGTVYSNKNKVHVSVDSGLAGLKCTGFQEGDDTSGFVTFSEEGTRVVTCTQPVEAQTDFNQPVNIALGYDYKAHISTTLLVKHVGE